MTTTLSHRDLANAIRVLGMDAVQKAKSGHPGAPMGMADIAEVLWRDFLKHNPRNPKWTNRDRFILSNGHASILIYSLLHLTGYDVSIDDLKHFRQLDSKTPGHPEYGYTPGVETTTGPLGQGIANAVGMAVAEKTLAARFNQPGYNIVDHYTYAFAGDGCLMEGISHEVCSLAGKLKLGKLILFYDDNGISIDGHVEGWFTDDTAKRFEAYQWHVIRNVDGHDAKAIKKAINDARSVADKPSLIICKTVIGFGSPNKCGSHDVHGAPLGENEIEATRQALGWNHPPFDIPECYYDAWDAKVKGHKEEQEWQACFSDYENAYPELAKEFTRRITGTLPHHWHAMAKNFVKLLQEKPVDIASRKASQNTIEIFGQALPELMGGSADLAPSNLTIWSGSIPINLDPAGNYIHYGVREFGMSAIMNGIALHGGFVPYGATFLIFMEYALNAVRMAALMKIRNIFVYTHDSIGLGEDGPTHQPVEQLAILRYTPNIDTWRPCDQVESAIAWQTAIERKSGPSALIFSRQNLTQQPRSEKQIAEAYRGGYILKDCAEIPDLIIIATGSEVALAVEAYDRLTEKGHKIRVVSMPCTEIFDVQDKTYKETVLPYNVTARLAIEAGTADFWYKYVGFSGRVIGMHSFGESAPAEQLFEKFGFTLDKVLEQAKILLK